MPDRPLLVVLRPLGLGDLLAAVPALRAVARAFPGHRRVLAAPSWQAPLARLTGAVHEVVDTAPLAPLPPELHGADVAINLHGPGHRSTAVLVASAPRSVIAFDRQGTPRWRDDEHERDRWCRLLTESGIPADPADFRLDVQSISVDERALGATVIHPGAAAGARRWPAERWGAVAAAERAAGRSVVITGSIQELELAATVARAGALGPDSVLAGRTSLLGLLGVVGSARRVVCGDTGIGHVASAVGTPSVILFGPTPPARWGPPSNGPHIALWRGREGDPHADVLDPGLAGITVEDVIDALAALPDRLVDAAGPRCRPAAVVD
jgi:ADP-heptose:LPS heptosyltransferase